MRANFVCRRQFHRGHGNGPGASGRTVPAEELKPLPMRTQTWGIATKTDVA